MMGKLLVTYNDIVKGLAIEVEFLEFFPFTALFVLFLATLMTY